MVKKAETYHVPVLLKESVDGLNILVVVGIVVRSCLGWMNRLICIVLIKMLTQNRM